MISVSVKGEKVVDHYGVMTSDFGSGENILVLMMSFQLTMLRVRGKMMMVEEEV